MDQRKHCLDELSVITSTGDNHKLFTFAGDLRGFATMAHGPQAWLARVASYIVPNLASLNVITRVSHDQLIPSMLVGYNTLYTLLYSAAAACGAVLIFSHRDLK